MITITNAGIKTLELVAKKLKPLFGNAVSINEEEALQLNRLLEKMREKE